MRFIGMNIPEFELDVFHQGEFKKVSDKDLKGKWSVLFFYPADFTFVCPTELEDLADAYEDFKKVDTEIYSISKDTHFVHKAWHDESKAVGKIEYPMVGDPTGFFGQLLDIVQDNGLYDRATFLINPEGEIVLYEVSADGIGRNSEELLRKVEAAQFVAKHGVVCPAKWKPGKETLTPGISLVGKI
ncbi:MAG: alkyl hydroperoxide reductase subunit C [Eubacteriales bacterium]|nr:alkyl hydroperoxide reductase subunit C [Eubacteriales bacterium]